jgi:hypothetical protein
MKRIAWVIFGSFVLMTSVKADDLTIDVYHSTGSAYDGVTTNSALRIPRTLIIGSSKCFQGMVDSDKDDQPCPAEWLSFTKTCKNEINKAIAKSSELTEYKPNVVISRLSNTGGVAMVVRNFEGGSGGSRHDWSIFILKLKENDKTQCPIVPALEGVEVSPGGNVWRETYCGKKESYEACAERIFYPKTNATRIRFGESGAQKSIVPIDANPVNDSTEKFW